MEREEIRVYERKLNFMLEIFNIGTSENGFLARSRTLTNIYATSGMG